MLRVVKLASAKDGMNLCTFTDVRGQDNNGYFLSESRRTGGSQRTCLVSLS
jgi:hypothetical protein